ncbi:HsdM family class I SAM-dependent methyltransferase [Gracilibacillus sp. HCP3S3_G5_1]|uniref:HsdM family class I SAM-dependent methyltransferase n=1 Tax=unclassified Gracilibacillus TaxID=2625209 RepID=UPI003F893F86
MGKADRKRWDGNVKSMEIISKSKDEITQDDLDFLKENYTSSGGLLPNSFANGAFHTPPAVAKFIWDALRDKLPQNPKVLEPSCGSGVFLEHAPEDAEITALEIDKTSAKVTSLLYPNANVIEGNAFDFKKRDYFDICIGNPPYGISVEWEDDGENWQAVNKTKGKRKGKSEVAFLEHAIKSVKYGGYIAFVLPMGLAYGNYAKKLRQLMYKTCWQVATILLPNETFAHVGTSVATQILIVRKATPNVKMIEPVTKKWGSNFRRSDWSDIDNFNASFLEGQTPAYFAKVNDIGWDKQGKLTELGEDGETQLNELISDFQDNNLMRENLYPHIPSWHGMKECDAFFFSHGNDTCDGHRDASLTFRNGVYRWNELTLGAGEEYIWNGEEVSTYDFDIYDQIILE